MQIVVQPRFPVEVLSLVAQVLLHPAVVLLLYRVTPDLIPRLPHDFPVTVRHLFRRAVHIRVKIQYPVRALFACLIHPRQRFITPRVAVDIQAACSLRPALLRQPHSVP